MTTQTFASEAHLTILVVEDDPDLQEVLREILAGEGYRVLLAGAVAEAFELCAGEVLHAALVDLNVPGGGGARVARALLATAPAPHVVVMSGDYRAPLPSGARLLRKPFFVEGLLRALPPRPAS